jgi:hypothetical protein
MDKMQRFTRKPTEVKIKTWDDDGKEITEILKVHALKVKDFELIQKLGEPDSMQETQKEIVKRVFEQNDIEWKDEIYPELDWDVVDKIIEVVMNLNNVEVSDAKMRLLEDLKKKQATVKNEQVAKK